MPIDTVMERLSPTVRIFVLVAGLAAVGGLLFMFTAGRGASVNSTPLPPPSRQASALPSAKSPTKTKALTTKASTTKATAPKATPKTTAPKPKATTKPTAVPAAPPSGFPAAVDAAFRTHEVVVVSLVVPDARVDELAAAEAREGARAAGVGFLALNVLNEGVARALLTKLGGLEDPTLLVLKRPDVVVTKLPGFVDRETVAQAAANASS